MVFIALWCQNGSKRLAPKNPRGRPFKLACQSLKDNRWNRWPVADVISFWKGQLVYGIGFPNIRQPKLSIIYNDDHRLESGVAYFQTNPYVKGLWFMAIGFTTWHIFCVCARPFWFVARPFWFVVFTSNKVRVLFNLCLLTCLQRSGQYHNLWYIYIYIYTHVYIYIWSLLSLCQKIYGYSIWYVIFDLWYLMYEWYIIYYIWLHCVWFLLHHISISNAVKPIRHLQNGHKWVVKNYPRMVDVNGTGFATVQSL